MNNNKRVTYADIARESGATLTTVSLVLRGMSNVPDEMRQLVLETARRLGYLPLPTTQALRASRITDLGVLVKSYNHEDIFNNLFYGEIINGVKSVCQENLINATFSAVPVDVNSYCLEIPQMIIDRKVNAVLAVGLNLDEESTMQIDRYGVPIVLVDAYSDTNAFDSVVSANYQGAYEAVTYLIELGHRKIGLVGSHPKAFPSILDRRRGYHQALLDNEILTPIFIDSPLDPEETYLACKQYLMKTQDLTAVWGVGDWITQGAMRAALELGFRIPEDISFMGFDGDASSYVPPLTTMQVDLNGMGQMGIRLLINRVENPGSALIKAALRPKLLVRQSTRRVEST
jgi:LacI family transcriptional regulator